MEKLCNEISKYLSDNDINISTEELISFSKKNRKEFNKSKTIEEKLQFQVSLTFACLARIEYNFLKDYLGDMENLYGEIFKGCLVVFFKEFKTIFEKGK